MAYDTLPTDFKAWYSYRNGFSKPAGYYTCPYCEQRRDATEFVCHRCGFHVQDLLIFGSTPVRRYGHAGGISLEIEFMFNTDMAARMLAKLET